ncbi:GH3 family domain-containing protein [Halobacteriovorax marinus]|uniref:GH3 family domain-containing protein n=1 Tax=Halobacteriovorax marinus TaxID=97084 RepID=UPI003A928BEB
MIRSFLSSLFQYLYKLLFSSKYENFLKSLENPKETQLNTLEDILEIYNHSPISKDSKVKTLEDFKALPIRDYNEMESEIKNNLLYPRPFTKFEKTSGSSGKNKMIPYPESLLRSFRNLFIIWSIDILKNIKFKTLVFYFSISPQFKEGPDDGAMSTDREYLGAFLSTIGHSFFVEISNLERVKDSLEFKMLLSLHLISNRKLEIISIWSPSFMTELWSFILENQDEISHALSKGEYESWSFTPIQLKEFSPKSCFPSLKFISTWGSQNAIYHYDKLKTIFKDITIQKKGLLATEAPITIPIFEAKGFTPLLNEVFMEFRTKEGHVFNLWEIEEGEVYEIIISQKGGLYRYCLKDLVIVTHFYKKTPCIDFYGRRDALSDLVGEKLHELDIRDAFKGTSAQFAIPDQRDSRYIIISEEILTQAELQRIEKRLRENYHYNNARELDQLKPLKSISIQNGEKKLSEYMENIRGIKKGDQKLGQLLYRESDGKLLAALSL